MNILWLQVWVLGLIQGSISLSWLVYELYLPGLLERYGFGAHQFAFLLMVERLLGVLLEPISGGLSDWGIRWLGSRFPFIAVGMIGSSLLFIAIPMIVMGTWNSQLMSLVLVAVIIGWAIAMTLFRSPALALLGRYASPTELPLAASLMTVFGGLVGSVRPFANELILRFDPLVVFVIASMVLLLGATALRWVDPLTTMEERIFRFDGDLFPLWVILGWIFILGIAIAWGVRLMMSAIASFLPLIFVGGQVPILMFIISLIMALLAVPTGYVASKIGNRMAMMGSLLIGAFILLILAKVRITMVLLMGIIGLVLVINVILNGVIPIILNNVPSCFGGLGIGMYFGGFSGAMSVFNLIFDVKNMEMTAGLAGICFLGGYIIILVGLKDSGNLEYNRP